MKTLKDIIFSLSDEERTNDFELCSILLTYYDTYSLEDFLKVTFTDIIECPLIEPILEQKIDLQAKSLIWTNRINTKHWIKSNSNYFKMAVFHLPSLVQGFEVSPYSIDESETSEHLTALEYSSISDINLKLLSDYAYHLYQRNICYEELHALLSNVRHAIINKLNLTKYK